MATATVVNSVTAETIKIAIEEAGFEVIGKLHICAILLVGFLKLW